MTAMRSFQESFCFPPQSRVTGIWRRPWRGDPNDTGNVVLFSHVRLGVDQDGVVESDFLSSHLPWALGGFHGVGPGGDPWLVIAQIAPGTAGGELIESGNKWWPLVDGLERALHYNGEAGELKSEGLDHADLLHAYANWGVDLRLIEDWPVTDLVLGLLAEFTDVPLNQLVDGYENRCAFPLDEHDCQHDVFADVFVAWAQGQLATPGESLDDDFDGEGEDVPDSYGRRTLPSVRTRHRWPKSRIKKWSTERLRLQAVEEGWTATCARKAGRKKLIKHLTSWHGRAIRITR